MNSLSLWAWQQDWGGPVEKLIAMHIANHDGHATFDGMASSANTTRAKAVNALDRLLANGTVTTKAGSDGARYILTGTIGGYAIQMHEKP